MVPVQVCCVCVCVCVCVYLGADDSLGGSLDVGRQTEECRSVVLWQVLYHTAVVLDTHTHTHTYNTHCTCMT